MSNINNFKLLSLREENLLSLDELEQYYDDLRAYVLNRKLTNTTPGATTIAPKLKKPTEKIAKAVAKAFTTKNFEWISEGQENFPQGAILFAHIHQGILDNFIWIPTVDRHCIFLHGAEVNKILLACQVNTGLVLVKKEDKEHRNNAKLDMIHLLLNGHSLTYFPEGTWNLSPNKIHLPLSFGFLDIARKAKVPVVPVVHEYTYDEYETTKVKKVHTVYGKPIYVGIEDNLEEKLNEYSEVIATVRYKLLEEKGNFNRSEMSEMEYVEFLKFSYKNLKLGKLDWAKETRNIFSAKDVFYQDHFINDVPYDENGHLLPRPPQKLTPNKNNAFLFNKRLV